MEIQSLLTHPYRVGWSDEVFLVQKKKIAGISQEKGVAVNSQTTAVNSDRVSNLNTNT